MARFKEKGVPTRKTEGALGDIYVDAETGIRYKCTNAYTVNGRSEYEWRAVRGGDAEVTTNTAETSKAKPDKKEVKAEAVSEEPVKEEVVESTKEETKEELTKTSETKAAESKKAPKAKSKSKPSYGDYYDKAK